ncbi:UNVERIFIED_CONTAM: hypothetical protein FKN15_034968 [Acipenser sinensis]
MATLLKHSAKYALSGRLACLGMHSRHGGLQCLQPHLLPHQRSASSRSKILVEMDDSTGEYPAPENRGTACLCLSV